MGRTGPVDEAVGWGDVDPADGRGAVVNEVTFPTATMGVLHELIPAIAKKRLRGYKGVGREDLEAACWLAAVEDAETVNRLVAEGSTAQVEARLTKAAVMEQASEERDQRARRAAACGYQPADEQFYSLGLLRALLPAWLDGGVSEHPPQGRELAARPQPAGGYGEWPVMMCDIDVAMKAIPEHHRKTLKQYFAFPQGSSGWTHLEIASAMGLNPEACRKRVYRALKILQGELGGCSPHQR